MVAHRSNEPSCYAMLLHCVRSLKNIISRETHISGIGIGAEFIFSRALESSDAQENMQTRALCK